MLDRLSMLSRLAPRGLALVVVLIWVLVQAACPGMGTADLGMEGGTGGTSDGGVDLSPCTMGDPACDPKCRGGMSPAYCVYDNAPTWSGCGPCSDVGYICEYFESELTCFCDHRWHVTYRPSCHSGCTPDGGFACTDGG